MDSQADYKAVRKAAVSIIPHDDFREVNFKLWPNIIHFGIVWQQIAIKRIDQVSPTMAETFEVLIRRISLLIINKNAIPHLMRRIKAGASDSQNEDDREVAIRSIARTLLKVRMACDLC